MRFSYNWIKSYFEEEIPKPKELARLLTMHSYEVEDVEEVSGDWLLNIDVLPNRAHDSFSHAGIAREVSAITDIKTKSLYHPQKLSESSKIKVRVQDKEAVRRLSALSVEDVEVGESPEWIKTFLKSLGLKPINNIVDATNLVMHHSGQPLHAYDRDRLTSEGGVVTLSARPARAGEGLSTLDDKIHPIEQGMLVITDDTSDKPLSIAGIKGGSESKIDKNTKNILVEAANFNPTLIRQTTRALKLRTDASDRFEKELSPELTRRGLEEFAALLAEISPSAVVEGWADAYPTPQETRAIVLKPELVSTKLGVEVSTDKIKELLERLGCKIEGENPLKVTPPAERLDLELPEDLVEEVGRLYGYGSIEPEALPNTEFKPAINKTIFYTDKLREGLVAEGYSEVMTYAFVSEGEVELANPLASDKRFLRASLLPELKKALETNLKNKELLGLDEVKLFEIGKVHTKSGEVLMLAKVSKDEEEEINLDDYIASQPEPETYDWPETYPNTKFVTWSPYPFVTRDIALWVPSDATPETIESIIQEHATDLLQQISLFDTFEKPDRTSLAFRLIFQSMERTLTDEEVNEIMDKISETLSKKGYEIR